MEGKSKTKKELNLTGMHYLAVIYMLSEKDELSVHAYDHTSEADAVGHITALEEKYGDAIISHQILKRNFDVDKYKHGLRIF